MGVEALDACDDTDDPKAAVIEALLHHMANPPPTPEPEPEPERPAVESTPEQAEFRKNLSEFRSIAMDMGALSVGEGDAGVLWDGEEEAGLVWSHATMELSVSPPLPARSARDRWGSELHPFNESQRGFVRGRRER